MNQPWTPTLNSVAILFWFRLTYAWGVLINLLWDGHDLFQKIESYNCQPLPLFQDLGLPVLTTSSAPTVYVLLCLSLVALGIGFVAPLFALASSIFFLLFVGTALGCAAGPDPVYMNWQHAIVFFNLLIFVFSPSVGFNFRKMQISSSIHSQYSLARSAICIFLFKFNLIYTYFAGGIAKLQYGLDWANGYTLQGHLIYTHLHTYIPQATFLITKIELLTVASWVVLVAELAAPIALFSTRFSVFFVLGTLMFQIACFYLIDLTWMEYFGWAYLIYVWDWFYRIVRSDREAKEELRIL